MSDLRLVRWSPLGGLIWFVGTLIAILVDTGSAETPAQVVERAEAHDVGIGIWVIVTLLSPLLLGWFVAGLSFRLRAAGAGPESTLALFGGTAFALLLFLVDVIVFVPLSELPNQDESVQLANAATILLLEDISWFLLGGAGAGAGLMIVSASLGGRRVGALKGWRFWSSLLLGVIAFATIAFFGAFAWLVWIGLASIALLARSR